MDTDTIERYDRQTRLWGQHGQSKCLKSRICLINADSLGTEILKGLCLAGIGSFVILDSHKLTSEDVGCNFIPRTCIGKSRGESVKDMLLGLNDEVSGEAFPLELHLPHITQTASKIEIPEDIASHDFWKQFSCIVVSGYLYTSQITRISKICWSNSTPLILCKSIGFYGLMRSQLRQHIVTETHPDWVPANFDSNKVEPVIINTEPLHSDHEIKSRSVKDDEFEDDFITICLCLMALDSFYSTFGRLPGCHNDQVETDIVKLKDCVKQLAGKSSGQFKTLDQCLYELCRYGGAELHATSAFMGGCIAQEVIKMITNQYRPVEDTLVYNAMSATTRTFKISDVFPQI